MILGTVAVRPQGVRRAVAQRKKVDKGRKSHCRNEAENNGWNFDGCYIYDICDN